MSQSQLDTRRIATEEKQVTLQQEGTLPPKTILQERYEVLGLQAVGGMGAIYRARDLRFRAVEKIIAVKEMANNAPDPRLRRISVQNFEREANILASLSHPAIPKIFDFFSEGTRSYLIMEFIEGHSLEEIVEERRQPFSPEECVSWALQACDVLAYLHSHTPPVIFRDMKPGNLMLKTDGRIMVIDFGIAKVFEHGQRGTMIGTEGYSPPEQYRGVAEPRGDLYAVGATLHHLLSGRDPRLEPPFTFHERPIRLFNPDVSPELESAIMKSLAYDIQERYSSAAEMAQALSRALPLGHGGTSGLSTAGLGTAGLGTTGIVMPQEVRPKWTFKCEDEVRSSPRVADDVLYVGCYDTNLYALDATNGTFHWKFATEGGVVSTPYITAEAILFGSEDGKVYTISRRTGHEIWTYQTNGPIRSSVRVEYGVAFFGSDDCCLYAINAQSGREVWKFQSAGPIRSTPLIAEEMIFVGSEDGYVYAVDMRNGKVKWKYNTHRRVSSSPAIEDNLVYVGSGDGHLHAINSRSGWPVWRMRTKGQILSSPIVVGGTVYIGSVDEHLYAVDASTGRQRWKYKADGPITSSPTMGDEVVYVGANDGAIHAVSAKQGRNVWRYVTGGAIPSSPLAARDTIYVGSNDHKVYALPL